MHYVYILASLSSNKHYFGRTDNVERRLEAHNLGQSLFTAKYRPWKLVWYAGFEDIERAVRFESYLKSGSGGAFLRKRLI